MIKALSTLPKDMPEAYKEVLDRIKKAEGEETARQVLSWLFHAQRPLKMGELREALSIETDPPDKDLYPKYFINPAQILNYCQGLVELDHRSQIIRFTHYTVQEFLTKNQATLLGRTDLAKVCLTYLTFDVLELGPCTSWKAFNQRKETYQFSDYAMRYWGLYVRGEGEEDAKILDSLLNLFRSPRKCNAIYQHMVWICNNSYWKITKFLHWTSLHIIASEGLAKICRRVLYDDRYIYSFICR